MSATPAETMKKMESSLQWWAQELDRYTAEQFAQRPADGQWAAGHIYGHLHDTALELQIPNVLECAQDGPKVGTGPTTIPKKLVWFLGGFPPMRAKTLPQFEQPTQPTLDEARAMLVAIKDGWHSALPAIEKSPADRRTFFKPFGWLNAREWFQLGEFHLRHHKHQKARLDKSLGLR